jgi:hypothetical protein
MSAIVVHMLKAREARLVTTRCGHTVELRAGQSLRDVGVTGREHDITCPSCVLPARPGPAS